MATVDVFDISHHNTIESWDQVDDVPIVHKVNEGTAVDRKVVERMPTIAGRHEQFGGYTVLIKSESSIRRQLEIYERVMGPYWRAGAMTQLDVEPWERYSRPVNADEVIEAHEIHVGMFGRAPALYINPRQMPGVLEEVRAEIPDVVLWEPHYGNDGRRAAMSNRATIHQWTSRYQAAGFTSGIDANEILLDQNWAKVCGLNLAPAPTPEPPEEPDMLKPVFFTIEGNSIPVYVSTDGITAHHVSAIQYGAVGGPTPIVMSKVEARKYAYAATIPPEMLGLG